MKQYVKKPIPVEAEQYNDESVLEFTGTDASITYTNKLAIRTLEGLMTCNIGDYVIKGVNDEYYPVRKDIFEKTYVEYRTGNIPCLDKNINDENYNFLDNDFINHPTVREKLSDFRWVHMDFATIPTYRSYDFETICEYLGWLELGCERRERIGDIEEIYSWSDEEKKLLGDIFTYLALCSLNEMKQLIKEYNSKE